MTATNTMNGQLPEPSIEPKMQISGLKMPVPAVWWEAVTGLAQTQGHLSPSKGMSYTLA